MKMIEVLTVASLLFPGAIASAYAQEKPAQEKAPEQKQEQAKPQAKPAQHAQAKPAQQQAKPPQAKAVQQPQRAEAKPAQQAKPTQEQAKPAQRPERAQAKPAQQPQRAQAKPAQQAQRAQAKGSQPSGAHGRIPDDKFRASFGRGHTFHVSRSDFSGRSRRFQYGGYWFGLSNPWPADWLYTDNVYVDYMNGGYFLCDPIHPGVYLSITIG